MSLRGLEEKKTYGFPILAEELSSDAPEMVSTGTRRESCIGSPARWPLDKLLGYGVCLFPLSANLLGVSCQFNRAA
jgi:hypothetical protein